MVQNSSHVTQMSYKYLNKSRVLKLCHVATIVAATGSAHIWVQETIDEVVFCPAAVM
jgi:hypothetical protein